MWQQCGCAGHKKNCRKYYENNVKELNKIKIYSLLATIFWLVRQFAIPNPFDALGEGLTIEFGEAAVLLSEP